MTTNPQLIDTGDIVTRLGDDRFLVIETNQGTDALAYVDLITVRCLVPGRAKWIRPGEVERVCPDDYEIVERGGTQLRHIAHKQDRDSRAD